MNSTFWFVTIGTIACISLVKIGRRFRFGKNAKRILFPFSELLEDPTWHSSPLRNTVGIHGKYSNRSIKCVCCYGGGNSEGQLIEDRYVAISCDTKPNKLALQKNLDIFSKELSPGFKLTGSKIVHQFPIEGNIAEFELSSKEPQQILDALIDACNKAEQADTKNS